MTPHALRPWEVPPTGNSAVLARQIEALVPEVLTERFRLRAPRIGDFPVYARFLSDLPISAAEPDLAEQAWLDFCQLVACWPLRGYGPWTIEARSGGEALGGIVLNHEFGDAEVELGWVVAAGVEGQGIATEAARAARIHAFAGMGFRTLVSYIDADNPRSIAVAERLGARRDLQAEQAIGHDCLVYRHQPETA
jgi:RimJ/RimL family protein N-acetyltransferase